jgi:hypothetical protein
MARTPFRAGRAGGPDVEAILGLHRYADQEPQHHGDDETFRRARC